MPGGKSATSADRFSTATRLKQIGEQTAERVYQQQNRRQARRSKLTGRAALLALVLCSLVLALAYPMRQYVSQRAEIENLRKEKAEQREEVEKLRDSKARWQDDHYAEQQIRERLHYVRPGETGYTMVGPKGERRPADEGEPTERPWYSNVFDGVDKADRSGG